MNQFLSQEKEESSKQIQTHSNNITEHKNIRVCQNFGSKLDEKDLFCTECGSKVEVIQEIQNDPKTEIHISNDRINAILNDKKELKSSFHDDIKNFIGHEKTGLFETQNQKIRKNDNRIGYYLSEDKAKKKNIL